MGMFGSKGGAVPTTAEAAAYEPSKLDVALSMLFGHGGPAENAEALRQIKFQQAMRPIQAQVWQQAMHAYDDAPDQGQPAPPPGGYTPPPTDTGQLFGNGIGQAIGTVAPYAPSGGIPQAGGGRPRIGDLMDPRVARRIMTGSMVDLPMSKAELEIGKATVQKNMVTPDGTVIGDMDPSVRGRQYRKAPVDGAIPSQFDAAGNTTDWMVPPGVQNLMRFQQTPAIMGATAALRAANTGEGHLNLDRRTSPQEGPPPGFGPRRPVKRVRR